MDDDVRQIASVLERAETSYGGGGGGGGKPRLPGWARAYAYRLLGWAGLPDALGREVGISELATELERLDRAYLAEPRSETWPDFYARQLVESLRRPAQP